MTPQHSWAKDANGEKMQTFDDEKHLVHFQSLPRGPEAKANCSDSTAGFFLSGRRTGQTHPNTHHL